MAYYASYMRGLPRVHRGEGRAAPKQHHVLLLLEAEVGVVGDSEHGLVLLGAVIGNVRTCFLRRLLLLVLQAFRRDGSFDGRRQIALALGLEMLFGVRDLMELEACVEWLLFRGSAWGLLACGGSTGCSCFGIRSRIRRGLTLNEDARRRFM